MVKALIEKGADVNMPGGNGKTPLMVARRMGNAEIVEALKAAGAVE
jgi:ankyrin repeat protein